MSKDIVQQTEEINDYIMRALYQDFFSTEMPSVPEYNLQLKIDKMRDLSLEEFGIADWAKSAEIRFAWKAAIREL